MSRTVDERIVEMQFNNKNFEKNVSQSLGTINKLNKSLKFENAAKGFEGITKAAKNVNFSSAANAVDKLSLKFSAMEVIAVTALVNITNKAVNMGTALLKSLTITPITSGWGKLEEKTASVQTLMNATGMSIDEINERLDKLMWFSDETSYSFTQMTSALSTMASAGMNIDEVIPAIMGIANATAYAGKGSNEFAMAINNVTQAYSKQAMLSEDWRSLNLAGVSTAALKQEIIDTAKALGKLNEESDITVANFEASLKNKWVDTEVMTKAFSNFASETEKAYEMTHGLAAEFDTASEAYAALGEQYDNLYLKAARSAQEAKTFKEAIDATKDAVSSGWMKIFETVFGNYEEAKRLWTDLANELWEVFAAPLEAAHEVVEGWRTYDAEFGDGRIRLLEAFWTAWYNIGQILGTIKQAFRDIFPATTAQNLIDLTKILLYFARSLEITELQGTRIYKVFRAVFSIFDIIKQVVAGLTYGGLNILNGLFEAFGTDVITVVVKIAELINKFRDWLRENDRLINAMGAVGKAIGNAIVRVVSFIKEIWNLPQVQNVVSKVVNFCSNLFESFGESIMIAYDSIRDFIRKFAEMDKKAALNSIINKISGFFTSIVNYVKSADFSIKDALRRIGQSFSNFGKTLWSKFKAVGGAFEWLGDKITTVYNVIKDKLSGDTLKIIIAAGIGVALVVAINKLKQAIISITKPLSSFTRVMDGFRSTLKSVSKVFKATAFETYAKGIVLITGAILALMGVLVLLTKYTNPKEIWESVKILGVLVAGVVAFALAMAAMSKIGGIQSIAGAANILALTILLSSTVKQLSKISDLINSGNITKSLGVVAKIMLMTAGVIAVMNLTARLMGPGSKTGGASALSILALAIAIKTIIKALNSIENVDTVKIMTIMSSLSSIILSFSVVGFLARGRGLGSAAAILATVIALKTIIKNLDEFTNVDHSKLNQALMTISEVMQAFSFAMISTALAGKYALRGSLAILVLLAAVKIVLGTIDDVASIDPLLMTRGLDVVQKIMSTLSLVMIATIASGKHAIKAALAVLIITAALKAIILEISSLEKLDPSKLRDVVLDIAILLGSLGVVLIATSFGSKSTGSMVSLMVMIGLLLTSVTVLADIDHSKLTAATLAVDSIMLVLSALISSVSKLKTDKKSTSGSLKSLIGLASVVAICGGIVIALTAIDPIGSVIVATGFSVLILAISQCIKTLSKMKEMPKKVLGTLLKFSAVIGVLGLIISVLDKSNIKGSAELALSASMMLLAISGAIRIANKIPEINGKQVGTLAVFGGVMTALMLAVGVISTFKNQNGGNMVLLTVTSAALLAAVVIAAKQVNKIPEINRGKIKNIGVFAAIVAGLSLAVSTATKIGGTNINSAITVIAGTIALLAAIIVAAKLVDKIPEIKAKQIVNIGVMTGVVVGLSHVVKAMDDIKPYAALANATALSEVLLAIVAAIKLIKSDSISPDTILSVGTMTAVVWGISRILINMSNVDYATALASATSLSMVLLSLAASVNLLSDSKSISVAAILATIILSAVVGGVMALLGILEQKDLTPSLETCVIFGLVLGELLGATEIIYLIGNSFGEGAGTAIIKGIATFGVVVLALTAIIGAIGGLVSLFDRDMGGLEAGVRAFKLIGEAIGGFVGGIVGGLLGGVAEGVLGGVGQGLSDFAEKSEDFFEMISKVGPDTLNGVKNLMEALLMLTGAEFVDGLNFLGGDNKLSDFGKQLKEFAPDFIDYVEQIKEANITEADVAASTAAAECILAFAKKVPNTGGFLAELIGDNRLDDFGQQLADFAPKFKDYYDEISKMTIDQSLVDASTNAVLTILAFAKKVPNTGGWLADIIGDNKLDDFGQQLADFAPKFKDYYDEISKMTIDQSIVDASAYAAGSVIAFAKQIPNEDGVLAILAGDNKLDKFAAKLPTFAHYFVAYWNIMQGISGEDTNSIIDLSTSAAGSVVEFAKQIPTSGSAFEWITGKHDLGSFGSQLTAFGNGFYNYFTAIKDIDFDKTDRALAGLQTLINLATTIDSNSGLSSELLAFEEQLGRIGDESVSKFLLSFSDIDEVKLARAIFAFMTKVGTEIGLDAYKTTDAFKTSVFDVINSGFETLLVTCTTSGMLSMLNFANAVIANSGTAQLAMATVFNAMTSYVTSSNTEMYNAGAELIANLTSGIANDTNYWKLYSTGKWIAKGLSDGMSSMKSVLISTSMAMGNAIESTTRDTLDINSPSRVMQRLGEHTVSGLINGLTEDVYTLTETSRNVAKSIPDTMKKELKIHSPSLVTAGIGGNIISGIVEGIKKYANDAINAMGDVSNGMSDKLKEFLSGKTSLSELFGFDKLSDGLGGITNKIDNITSSFNSLGDIGSSIGGLGSIDTSVLDELATIDDLEIEPVLDTDSFKKQWESLLDDDYMFDLNLSTPTKEALDDLNNIDKAKDTENRITNNYNFTQTNNSPRALNRLEIYRQTRNQLAMMKGVIDRR